MLRKLIERTSRRAEINTSMKHLLHTVILALAVSACGGSSSSATGGAPTSPTPSPSPLTLGTTWSGTFSDSDGAGTMRWRISTQAGSSFSATLTVTQNDQTGSGNLTGTLAADQVTFRFAIDGCPNSCLGTGNASVSGSTIAGTYQAVNLLDQSVSGQFTLTRQP